ncbi:tetratricopeptide repeat protein [Chitinophaga nivalis]|uniref:Tetratricopeptide repeat protein n=1 Tax=Chitinophaga nivalis TaxID=2991709 RepID=A0ABT3INK2_9BACT|nr:tetratricopeptide repeat protein [Chitinophaga nivalis]MCW3464775.1 tetratricopeptide repeat protein [Chitinophaga nivalis]MCW3485534.1 tetratricopeptide repeat protein [Chitinophaga nivalis]
MKSIILSLLLLVTLSVYAQQNGQSEVPLFDQAKAMYDAGKYDEALILVNQLLANNMVSEKFFDLRGEIYLAKGNMDSALVNYNAGLLLAPTDPMIYFHRAFAYCSIRLFDEGIADYNTAIKYVGNEDAKYGIIASRGLARVMSRDFSGAYKDYKMVLDFDSTNVMAWVAMGSILRNLGRSNEATAYYEKAVNLAPNEIVAVGDLGFHYMSMKDYQKAIRQYTRVLEIDPDNAIAYNNLGHAKYQLKDLKNALKDIQRSIALDPKNAYAYRNRALVYLAMKQPEKACEDLHQAINLGYTVMYGDDVQQLLEKHCVF